MSRIARHLLFAAFACGLAGTAVAEERAADAIVQEIEAIPEPTTFDEYKASSAKKAELIAELAKAHPGDARLVKLLPQRWLALVRGDKVDVAKREIDATLAKADDRGLKAEATFWKAQVLMVEGHGDATAARPVIEDFLKLAPKDRRCPMLLAEVAESVGDKAGREAIEARILKNYPDSPSASQIKGLRKQREMIGKPFELEFTDAIKGSTVSMKSLRGKVVVVDFWATWCGPCVAEMPTMKKLYAEYKDKGVEFIGVSLDEPKEEGGLDALKKFVAAKEIAWPQYYQGKGWDSAFSKSWGVTGIPCVFVVDADGNLYSTEARGKLADMIPELLAKKAKAPSGAGE